MHFTSTAGAYLGQSILAGNYYAESHCTKKRYISRPGFALLGMIRIFYVQVTDGAMPFSLIQVRKDETQVIAEKEIKKPATCKQ